MCLILIKPANTKLDLSLVEKAWRYNPDGGGYAYNGRQFNSKMNRSYPHIYRYQSLIKDTFLEQLEKDLKEHSQATFLIHVRTRTVGDINQANCNPFFVQPNLCFAHNGTLDIEMPKEKELIRRHGFLPSDTFHLNEVLQRWYKKDKNFLANEKMLEQLEKIAKKSRIAFLHVDGAFQILNEEGGVWESGIWRSKIKIETIRAVPAETDWHTAYYKRFNYTTQKYDYPTWERAKKAYKFPGNEQDYKPLPVSNITPKVSEKEKLLESAHYEKAIITLSREDYLLDNYACHVEIRNYHRSKPSTQANIKEVLLARGVKYNDTQVSAWLADTKPVEKNTVEVGSPKANAMLLLNQKGV